MICGCGYNFIKGVVLSHCIKVHGIGIEITTKSVKNNSKTNIIIIKHNKDMHIFIGTINKFNSTELTGNHTHIIINTWMHDHDLIPYIELALWSSMV